MGTMRSSGYSRRRRSYGSSDTWFWVLVVLFFAVVIGVTGAVTVSSRHTETCTVDSKDRTSVSDGNGSSHSDARVYTTDCGVLRVKDSIWAWNWHSADTYASIKAGKRYEFTVQGFRIPFFSKFPNIIEVREVTS